MSHLIISANIYRALTQPDTILSTLHVVSNETIQTLLLSLFGIVEAETQELFNLPKSLSW